MKKILYAILLAFIALFPGCVLAEGYVSVSPASITIEQGSSKTFVITAYNTIGDVSIKSNNTNIASVNLSEWSTGMIDEKQTKPGTITVTGKSVGTTTITLTIDAATFDSEDLSGQIKTITVNVIEKITQKPVSTTTKPLTTKPTTTKPTTTQNNLSKNSNLKSISVEGYELKKVDNNNYTLAVLNNVSSINIKATAEDSKAKISGTGNKELHVGENVIELIISAEDGTKNKVTLKVTRKDAHYLEDIDLVLKKDSNKVIDIKINADSKLSNDTIAKIKESKKTLRLNYYDENKNALYSWIIDGEKIEDINEFSTSIAFTSENSNEIYKLANYADGIYVDFEHDGDLPKGTKVKLYVGKKIENGNVVNLYYYNKDRNILELIKEDLIVKDGYIEFEIEHCSKYFVTMSTINNADNKTTSKPIVEKTISKKAFLIYVIVSTTIIIGLIMFIVIKFRTRKKKSIDEKPEDTMIEIIEDIEIQENVSSNKIYTNINDNSNVQNANQYTNVNNNGNLSNVNSYANVNNTNISNINSYSNVNNNQNISNVNPYTNVNNGQSNDKNL